MKLSRSGWNNVIIISVMIFILIINATNEKLFPRDEPSGQQSSMQTILPKHSAIVVLTITNQQKTLTFERIGITWSIKEADDNHAAGEKNYKVSANSEKVEQLILAWQSAQGLVQADDVIIEGMKGVSVSIDLANNPKKQLFTVYPLSDQLLLFNHQTKLWLSMPAAMNKQLLF